MPPPSRPSLSYQPSKLILRHLPVDYTVENAEQLLSVLQVEKWIQYKWFRQGKER